ncbi:LysR family transcriptional regulator [Burkholderia alba]|uniref:LysR family transcriptional regulator n=1 Tax=Burkholderia alba TaxID=2683677 RepID=UPI002B053D21|nr:LysR family transcriptional regulator [Burkholderia alba]
MRFDIADLRLFVAVVEAGSITHGAQRANLALGSASGRIRQMEDAVGVPLFERRRLGVVPTEAGHALLKHARTLLTGMQRMTDDLGAFARGLKGTVRLLANTNALTEFVPGPVAQFLAAHPNVNIEVEERLSHEIVGALLDGVADIGIVAAAAEIGTLQSFPFATDRLCAVVPARVDAFEPLREIDFAALLSHDFVGHAAGAAIQEYLDAQARALRRRVRTRIRLRSFDAICRMVENGVGVSVVPESAARRCKRTMAIRVLRIADPWALREMRACVKDRDALPAYARQLLDHLVESGAARRVRRAG